jgi:hypothetical protein
MSSHETDITNLIAIVDRSNQTKAIAFYIKDNPVSTENAGTKPLGGM